MRHQMAALDKLSRAAILEQGKRLGLVAGGGLLTENMDEVSMIFDLLLYTAPPGRSRGIDRYASSAAAPPGSDDEVVIRSLQETRFSIWKVQGFHELAGMILEDLFREETVWFMDQTFEQHVETGAVLAMRVSQPDRFCMHCGVLVPLELHHIMEIFDDVVERLKGEPGEIADDRRFAAAIYRLAVEDELFSQVGFREMAPGDDETP